MSDPEDLEDGEIEDDEDDAPTEDPPLVQPTPADYLEHEEKHKEPHHHQPHHHHHQASDEEVKPVNQTASSNHHHHSNKSQRASNKPAPVVDDWATKVENAIANALKRDGVQPPMPSSVPHAHELNESDLSSAAGSRKSKKRKRSNRGGGGGGGGGGVGGGDGPQHHSKQQRLGEPDGDDGEMMDLEYEMLNVRGSSPQGMMGGRGDSGHSDGSDGEDDTPHGYSSDDSTIRDRDGHSQPRGGGSRRDQRERDRERERERERDRESRNRNKRKPSRQRGNNNKSGRDGRKRKRDDSDDEKHRPTGPRKMELCKFYLMDCCAKREKCLYMHKDFPCKYYYLGMKCKEKEKCLFSHGEPLSDDLRAILLKHLETAPQEILGSFQRIGRDMAVSMLNSTHRKLQERYGIKPDQPGGKIPSLLDVTTHSPKHSRKSRWCERQNDERDRGRGMSDGEPTVESVVGDMVNQLAGIITPAQISDLEQMGIRTLDEISQLTVAQLNELGLSITQIHDLQVCAMNALKQANLASERMRAAGGEMRPKDHDMRMMPPMMVENSGTSNMSSNEQKQQPPGDGGGGGGHGTKDVDMRVLPAGERDNAPAPNTNQEEVLPGSLLMKPPTVDYSQYIKDSNLDEEDLDAVATDSNCLLNDEPAEEEEDDDDDDDDENHLKISIDEEEEEEKKECDENETDAAKEREAEAETKALPLPPLVPPKIDYAQGLGDILMYGSTAIADKTPHQASESPIHRSHRSPSPATKDELPLSGADALSSLTDVWTPSMADSQSNSSQTLYAATQQPKPSNAKATGTAKRSGGGTSIYDWDDSDNGANSPDAGRSSPVTAPFRYGSDRSMPLDIGEDDPYTGIGSGGGAREASSELGFPFKSIMANYVPATEIDGSIGSHAPITYKVYVVDVPRPNYGMLRRSMARPVGTKDPRLRRLFGLLSDDEIDADDASDGIKSPDPNPGTSPLYGNSPSVHPPPLAASKPAVSSGPRIDPRKRHAEKQQLEAAAQQQQTATAGNPRPSNVTPQIDVQAILQKSPWYKDLGSKHKIMVNQQLAILSTEMKKYHNSERTTEQLSEFMKFLGTNSMLQHILTCLNVFVDDSVTFCEVPVVPNIPPPALPMLPNIPPPSLSPAALQLPVPMHVPPPLGPMTLPPPHQPNVGPPMFLGAGPNGDPFGRQHDQQQQQQQTPQGGGPPPPGPGMIRPGLLGVSPNMPFEQFLAMGNVSKSADGGPGIAGNNGPLPPWVQGNGNNMRNMRNNNRVGHNFRNNNDRWNNNGGGPGGQMGGNNNNGNGGGNNRRNNNNNNNRRMDRKK